MSLRAFTVSRTDHEAARSPFEHRLATTALHTGVRAHSVVARPCANGAGWRRCLPIRSPVTADGLTRRPAAELEHHASMDVVRHKASATAATSSAALGVMNASGSIIGIAPCVEAGRHLVLHLWVHGALEEWRAAAGAALVDEDDRRCDRRGEGTSLPGSGRTTRPRRPSPPGMWKTAVLAPLTLWPMMVAWSWTLARDLGTNHPVTVPHRTISSSPSTRPNAESIRPARRPQVREPCMPEARGERGGFASFTRAVAIVWGFKLVRPFL